MLILQLKRYFMSKLSTAIYFLMFEIFYCLNAQPEFPLVPPYLYPIENNNGHPSLQWTKDNPNNRVIGYYIYKKVTLSSGQIDTVRYFTEVTTYLDSSFGIGGIKPEDTAKYWVIVLGKTEGKVDTSKPFGSRTIHGNNNIQGMILGNSRSTDMYNLSENYPNPFNPITTIRYDLPEDSFVELRIYDLMGKEVKMLLNKFEIAGFKSIKWDGKDSDGNYVSSGMYLYRIDAISYESFKEFHQTRKMILIR